MAYELDSQTLRASALICVGFLLTSTGWLSWEYHLLDFAPAQAVDVFTMVLGYLLQALGIGIFAALVYAKPSWADAAFLIALVLYLVFLVPSVLSPYYAGTLAFGLLSNVACGMVAGAYLYILAAHVGKERRASAFAIGYAVSIAASWLLSALGGGEAYYSGAALLVCAVLTAVAVLILRSGSTVSDAAQAGKGVSGARAGLTPAGPSVGGVRVSRPPTARFLLLAGLLVLLFSLVNSTGFAFSSADLNLPVNMELSRLLYALGLVIAGVVTDRSRKYGAICALAALMVPFVLFALQGETVSVVVFWALAYFTFGFYAVFRIIVFSDLSADSGLLFLSGFGLMLGRVGDALGEALCLAFDAHLVVLIVCTAALFVLAVVVFFGTYNTLYVPEIRQRQTERERFFHFSSAHDLSAREQDMLRLLLDKKTNSEIAAALFISENTVKFHMRNLLQKTGCKNRSELLSSYLDYFA